jgi:hypothetical protein
MCLSVRVCGRVRISLVALFACLIVWTISLSSPRLGQAYAGERTLARHPRAPHPLGHGHVRGAMIVCDTSDVHSCHREFKHRHGGQPAHHE